MYAGSCIKGQLFFTRWYTDTLRTTALVMKDCAFEHLVTTVSNINSAACQKTEAGNTVALYILEVTKEHVTDFNFMQFTAHRKCNRACLSVHMPIRLHVITFENTSLRCRISSISTKLNATFFFFCSATALLEPRPPHCWSFEITHRHTTLARSPLDEVSPRPRDLWEHTTFIRNRNPCSCRDSNPQTQQASGRRPTP
jgi:hypothetical protein